MSTHTEPLSPSAKMKKYRAKMRAKGLRQVQMWVYDMRNPKFIKELERQSRLVSKRKSEKEALDFIESVMDWSE